MMKNKLIFILFLLVISLGIYNFKCSVIINNDTLTQYVSSKTPADIAIKLDSLNETQKFILYEDENAHKIGVALFKQNSLFRNRYNYILTFSSNQICSTAIYTDDIHNERTIIVYGINNNLASHYVHILIDGCQYIEDISNKYYYIYTFIVDPTVGAPTICLYDENNNKLRISSIVE